MGVFAVALQGFRDKVSERANVVVHTIVLDIGSSLVLKSPVGDAKYWKSPPPKGYVGGHFRGNWRYGCDAPDAETSDALDRNGTVTIRTISGELDQHPDAARHDHYITNALPYGERLENGWSRQAPQGMVGLTVMEFQPIVARAVASVQ